MLDLIYCAGGNEPLMRAAYEAGWLLGVRSDRTSYGYPLSFIDVDYKRVNWQRHLARVAEERQKYAVVPDLSATTIDAEDVKRALLQADALAEYCQTPLIVPKLSGQLKHIPSRYAIAYSVPSTYGGAQFGPWQLGGRTVHLLGGSPSMQRRIYRSLRDVAQVISVDGNMAQKVGLGKLNYWSRRNVWVKAPKGTPYLDCWRASLENIYLMWWIECGHAHEPPTLWSTQEQPA